MEWTCFSLDIIDHIAHVQINRPDKANALNAVAWKEMISIFEHIRENPEARVVVLSGNGNHFCSGIDLSLLMDIQAMQKIECDARKREAFRKNLLHLQHAVNTIEQCGKPVLAAIHNGCIGAGVDIVCACDMRYCTDDAFFSVKEVDMGLVADLGTLQRLPKIISPAIAAEMSYTARRVSGKEAEKIQLVNHTEATKEDLMAYVMKMAAMIASKSPVVTRGIKEVLLHSRDHSVADGLNYISVWNAAMFYSKDLEESFMASMQKRAPKYAES